MLVAGIMSGTSADAIDVALVEIRGRGWNLRHRLVAFHAVSYPAAVRRRILALAEGSPVPAGELARLHFLLGELFAEACLAACRSAGIPRRRLQLIGSHGQTVFHQGQAAPYCARPVRATLQLGEPAVIAERTGVTTIADFRPADMAAGGQGAPLVPYFDYLTYRHPRRGRLLLNIGGIANLTAIPAAGRPEDVIAFDTGPGNMLIDALASRLTNGQKTFDAGGRLAARGTISESAIRQLMRQRYFRMEPPKSAGREQFGSDYLKRYFTNRRG
ncbi:MAG TPA: anhydro-N-acetylmuramic acid kinase, partial [Terriglobia bacterium]|nr:anhydro-N-acetylmuramic acid kinase [Terriglobia bacterium]